MNKSEFTKYYSKQDKIDPLELPADTIESMIQANSKKLRRLAKIKKIGSYIIGIYLILAIIGAIIKTIWF